MGPTGCLTTLCRHLGFEAALALVSKLAHLQLPVLHSQDQCHTMLVFLIVFPQIDDQPERELYTQTTSTLEFST
jgi:hypothetical protein